MWTRDYMLNYFELHLLLLSLQFKSMCFVCGAIYSFTFSAFSFILVVCRFLSSFISLLLLLVSIALIRSGYHELVCVEWVPSQPYLTSDFCRVCNKNREVCWD